MTSVSDFLAAIPLFHDLSALERNAVGAFLEPERHEAGSVIFSQGETGQRMYIVKEGRVTSFVPDEDGGKREIYEFTPGRFFGEMAIIENEPRSATCIAKEPTELLVLEGIDFYRLVWEYSMIGVKLLSAMARVMVSWLRETSGFLNDLVRWGETARRRAVTDDLSGLFNRRFLEETMHLDFKRDHRHALLMLDLDRFREINSRFGVDAGDAVISQAGALFSRVAGDGAVVSRLSGDEFAFFLPGGTVTKALSLAEAVRAAAEALFIEFRAGSDATPERVKLTVSVGIAVSPEHARTQEALIEAADKALFRAKETGRNRVELWLA